MIMDLELDTALDKYLEAVRANYRDWKQAWPCESEADKQIRETMIGEFYDGLHVEEGSKYIKVVSLLAYSGQQSVHSFIVKKDGPKFKRGDILKAASWGTPAKNFARGNVVDVIYNNVQWTGA